MISLYFRLIAFLLLGFLTSNSQNAAPIKAIPDQLVGRWIVKRMLPTTTISCWSKKDADGFIGTILQYSPNLFRWKDVVVKNPRVEISVLSAAQFHIRFSSASASGSQVDFKQLGISGDHVMMIDFLHSPANITGSTIEIPGDRVFLRDASTIIVTVCNMYFEAKKSNKTQ